MGGNGKGYLDESRWQLERGPSSDSCENSGSTTEEDNNQQSRAKIPSHLSRQTFCFICRRENVLELPLLEPNHKGRIDTTQEWRINMIKFALIQPIFDEGLLRENTMSLSICFAHPHNTWQCQMSYYILYVCMLARFLPISQSRMQAPWEQGLHLFCLPGYPQGLGQLPTHTKFPINVTWKCPSSQSSQRKAKRKLSRRLQCNVARVRSPRGKSAGQRGPVEPKENKAVIKSLPP